MAIPQLAWLCVAAQDAEEPGGSPRAHDRAGRHASRAVDHAPADAAADGEILAALAASDVRVYEQLFDDYALRLERYAASIVGTGDVARDIVQDVFVALWERRSAVPVRTTLRAYLFAAARGLALMALRRARAEAARRAWIERGPEIPGMGTAPTTDSVEQQELRAIVTGALAELPPRTREVAQLRWYDMLSYAEIAEACGTSVKTVDNQLQHAARVLRQRLGPLRSGETNTK